MKRGVTLLLLLVLTVGVVFSPVNLRAASDDFETLEFFLDQSLKRAEDSSERLEILNRYLIKALALVYGQNKELIRLQREALNALQELKEIEAKETRELELRMQRK